MDPLVLSQKLRCPDPIGLPRGRLESRLCDPSGPDTALVLGPPGSGKTTLLGKVAASASTAAWYRASEEDADESALVSHLGAALGSALADRGILESGRAGRVDALITELERPRIRPIWLVVDDLHEIVGTDAERSLERFVNLRPRGIRIVLGSRCPPAMNTDRLLVSGELCQLDADDLRFRTWEVEDLFRSVYRQPLSPEAAAALTRRTGGWAAGLQLFHLASLNLTQPDRERAVADLSGRSSLIRSYLARNVLAGLDGRRRSFLLRTCALGVLSAPLCDELLESSGSAGVLRDLQQQQFFTTSNDGGRTYRYHQVLQTYLEVSLTEEMDATAVRQLYARSGALLERSGHISAALRAHARAEDWGAVARLLQQTSSSLPIDDPLSVFGLRGLALDDPGVVLAGARRLFRSGRITEAVAGFQLADSLLDDPEFHARCAGERAIAVEWLADPPTGILHRARPADRTLATSQVVRRFTRTVVDATAEVGLIGGIGRLLAGDMSAAVDELRLALTEPGLETWEVLAIRLAAQVANGDPPDAQAASQLEEIVLAADLEALPWLSRLARGLQCAVLLATHPAPWRLASAIDLVEECRRQGDPWARTILALLLGAVCITHDEHKGAHQLLGIAAGSAAALRAPVLQAWVAWFQAIQATQNGDPGAAHIARQARALGSAVGVKPECERLANFAATPTASRDQAIDRKMPVELRCLGGFGLSVRESEIDWRGLRPRAQMLLMFLAMRHRHVVHREELIAALWPDATLVSGIHCLQVAVSSVRRCLRSAGLAEETLHRQGETYGLLLAGARIQVEELELLIHRAAHLEAADKLQESLRQRLEALDLYSGDLLLEMGPAEWVVAERERLRVATARVGTEAAQVALTLGQPSQGVRAARRAIELDPYGDQAWTLLISSFEQLGDHSAAVVARRQHARVCADLGV